MGRSYSLFCFSPHYLSCAVSLLSLPLLVQWRIRVLEAERNAGMYVAPLGRILQQAVVGIAAPPTRIPTSLKRCSREDVRSSKVTRSVHIVEAVTEN